MLDNRRGVVDRAGLLITGILGTALGLGLGAFVVSVVSGAVGPASAGQRIGLAVVGTILVLVSVGAGLRAALGAVTGAGQTWTVDRNGIEVRDRSVTGTEVVVHLDRQQARSLEFETVRDGDHPEWRLVVLDGAGRRFRYPLGTDRARAFRTHDQVLDALYGREP